MSRWFNGDMALSFVLGFLFLLFGIAVTSYQVEHCGKVEHRSNNAPHTEPHLPVLTDSASEENDEESRYDKSHPIACEFIGYPSATIGYVDHHEGFFVGLFTLGLVLMTWRLWRSTEKLWEAGERQIAVARISADAAYKSAVTAEKTFTDLEGPFLYPVLQEFESKSELGRFIRSEPPHKQDGSMRAGAWFKIKNYGRALGIPYYVDCELVHLPDTHSIPKFVRFSELAVDAVIGADSVSVQGYGPKIRTRLTPRDIVSINTGNSQLVFHGEIGFSDMFGAEYIQNFTLAFDTRARSFAPLRGLHFNKRQRKASAPRAAAITH